MGGESEHGMDGAGEKLSYAEELWSHCNRLRPKMEAAEYKHVILRIYSLFALSDLQKTQSKRVQMPAGTLWKDIKGKVDEFAGEGGKNGELEAAKHIDEAMIQVAEANSEITGCFPPVFERLMVNNETIQELMERFSETLQNQDPGTIYQFFLRKFAEIEGRGGGEFFTPESILDVMVRVLNFTSGTIYEPCFGAGSMIAKTHKHSMEATSSKKQVLKFYAQEANPTNYHIGKVHMFILGIEVDFALGDTLLEDAFEPHATGAIANPPFNLKEWTNNTVLLVDKQKDGNGKVIEIPKDDRWKAWGPPPKANANFAWMQHIDYHCNSKTKRWGVVFSKGTLSNSSSSKNRQIMTESDSVLCVLSLPTQLFTNTPIPSVIWFGGTKPKHRKGETLFINCHEVGRLLSRTLRELEEGEIEKIANTFAAWVGEGGCDLQYEDEVGYCRSVSINEIRDHNFVMSPGRFVGVPSIIDTDEALTNLDQIISKLSVNFVETTRLENEVKKGLKELGYDV
tara:strand:- start:468 stop:2000 length:1533 start_codon:yes stop_codon:yes gene_type:complete